VAWQRGTWQRVVVGWFGLEEERVSKVKTISAANNYESTPRHATQGAGGGCGEASERELNFELFCIESV